MSYDPKNGLSPNVIEAARKLIYSDAGKDFREAIEAMANDSTHESIPDFSTPADLLRMMGGNPENLDKNIENFVDEIATMHGGVKSIPKPKKNIGQKIGYVIGSITVVALTLAASSIVLLATWWALAFMFRLVFK